MARGRVVRAATRDEGQLGRPGVDEKAGREGDLGRVIGGWLTRQYVATRWSR